VAVAGALGRMGASVCASVAGAEDLALVGGFVRASPGRTIGEALCIATGAQAPLCDDLASFYATRPDVVVDFTVQPISVTVVEEAVKRGISPVVGATGWTTEAVDALRAHCAAARLGALLVPNFAIGAVLMMRFAEAAARCFPTVEIVELHHDAKRDRPSGTARLTAERIAAARDGREVPVHSVRLRGLVAHQEVLFGGDGETLTIRHDSFSRDSFMAGVLLAVRRVRGLSGLTIGLDPLLDLGDSSRAVANTV